MKAFFAAWRRFQDAVVRHPLCSLTILPAGIFLAIWLTGFALVLLMWGPGGREVLDPLEVIAGLDDGFFSVFILAGVGLAGGLLTGRLRPMLAALITTGFALEVYVSQLKGCLESYGSFFWWCQSEPATLLLLLVVFGLAGFWLLFPVPERQSADQPALTRRLKQWTGMAAGVLFIAGLVISALNGELLQAELLLSLLAAFWFSVFLVLVSRLIETGSGRIFYCLFAAGVIVLCILRSHASYDRMVLWFASGLAILSCLPWDAWMQRLWLVSGWDDTPDEPGRPMAPCQKLILAGALALGILVVACLGWGWLKARAIQPLFTVCKNGTPEQVQAAIGFWTNVNARDGNRETPLMLAARYNTHPQVVTILHRAGADVNACNYDWTPLTDAIESNPNPEVIAALLQAGAKVNTRHYDQRTPLMMVAGDVRHPDTVRIVGILLQAGADVNARHRYGLTPLMWAVEASQNPEVAKTLIRAGAEVNARDNHGRSVLDYAKGNKNQALAELLLQAGAK